MSQVGTISLKNFKCFENTTSVQIRPLTLFYGYNSSGKSALLRGLSLVLNSLNSSVRLGEPLDRSTSIFPRELSLGDVATQGGSQSIEIGVDLVDRQGGEEATLHWRLLDLPERSRYVVERFKCENSDADSAVEAEWTADDVPDVGQSLTYSVRMGRNEPVEAQLEFTGLIPSADHADIASLLPATQHTDCCWMESERIAGNREFRRATPELAFSSKGVGFSNLLRYSFAHSDRSELFQRVSNWYREHLGLVMWVEESTKNFSIGFSTTNSPNRINLCDVGQGLQELLPVMTALHSHVLGERGFRFLAVEEPESHLHPKLHGELGREFCKVAQSNEGPQILLETHSQNLLLGVQLAIAEEQVDPHKVAVYWVRQDSTGVSTAELVEFDRFGRPSSNWPPGVFADDIRQARKLLAAQQKLMEQ